MLYFKMNFSIHATIGGCTRMKRWEGIYHVGYGSLVPTVSRCESQCERRSAHAASMNPNKERSVGRVLSRWKNSNIIPDICNIIMFKLSAHRIVP